MVEHASIEQLNLGLLLFIPYRALENRVFAALAAAGLDDFTPAQARVFQRIGPNGTRLTELAQAAQVTKQSTSSNGHAMSSARPIPLTLGPASSE